MSPVELSIVMPGYNESQRVKENIISVKNELSQHTLAGWEIIFVNDGSTDESEEIVSGLSTNDARIRLVSYKKNKGRGFALREGISVAIGEFILTIESDLNYGTKIIFDLFKTIKESQTDIVVASPYMKGGKSKNVPFKRSALSKWGNVILSYSVGHQIHTLSGMTRIYRRECIRALPLVSDDKEIHLEIISKALSLGYTIREIPATLSWPKSKTPKKEKRIPSFKPKKYIISHLVFSFFERPLLFFGLLGLGNFITGIVLGLYVTYLRFSGQLNPDRPLMILIVLMVLSGILFFSFGLLGIQIKDLRSEIYRIQKALREKQL